MHYNSLNWEKFAHTDIEKNLMGAALNFLTHYEEDGNDLLERIITGEESWIHFYEPERKSVVTICLPFLAL